MRARDSSRNPRVTVLTVTAAAALMSVWMVGGASATTTTAQPTTTQSSTTTAATQAQTVEVPIEQTRIQGTPGSAVEIGSTDVPAGLVGETCEITIDVVNQQSIHSGNKLIVESDGSSVEVEGIEDAAGSTTTKAGTITLGATIDVSVFLAVDDASSLGSSLTVTCTPLPAPPPTVAPPTTVPAYTG